MNKLARNLLLPEQCVPVSTNAFAEVLSSNPFFVEQLSTFFHVQCDFSAHCMLHHVSCIMFELPEKREKK